MDRGTINNVIFSLNTNKSWIDFPWLQLKGNNGKNVEGLAVILQELKRLELIHIETAKDGSLQYLLTLATRNSIKNLPSDFENNPYGYFLDEERKKQKAENDRLHKEGQILDLQIDDLADRILKQPKVKSRLFRAEIIATISAAAALLSAIAAISMMKGC